MRFFRKITGGVLFLLAVFLLLSLLTYSPDDPSILHAVDTAAKNWLGIYGAFVADFMIQTLGYASFLPIVFLPFG